MRAEYRSSLLRIPHSSSTKQTSIVIGRALLAALSYPVLRRARGALARWILVTILCCTLLLHTNTSHLEYSVKITTQKQRSQWRWNIMQYSGISGYTKNQTQATDGQHGPAQHSQNQNFSRAFLGTCSGHTSASRAALPVQISASSGLTNLVRLKTFQNAYKRKKMGIPT
jgi:hypothetical protein